MSGVTRKNDLQPLWVELNHSGQRAQDLSINLNRNAGITLHSDPFRWLNDHVWIITDKDGLRACWHAVQMPRFRFLVVLVSRRS